MIGRDLTGYWRQTTTLPSAYETPGSTGGSAHRLAAERLFEASQSFLATLPWRTGLRLLDVGAGYGFHSRHFASRGARVTALTIHASSTLAADARDAGYALVAADMHAAPMIDGAFDGIWSHHALEHSVAAPMLLREWYRMLTPGGWLAVTVPPHKDDIVSGHLHTGWNVGQLVYLTGLAGFELRGGRFLQQGYNVRALVRRPTEDVDPTGLSWLRVLKGRLPPALVPYLREHPNSLGAYSFPGRIAYLDDDRCEFLF